MFNAIFGETFADLRRTEPKTGENGYVGESSPIFFMFCTSQKLRNLDLHLLHTGLFVSPSGNSELDCATTKTDTAERTISIGRESLKVFFVLGALAYLQFPPLGGSRDEKWRAQ